MISILINILSLPDYLKKQNQLKRTNKKDGWLENKLTKIIGFMRMHNATCTDSDCVCQNLEKLTFPKFNMRFHECEESKHFYYSNIYIL